MNIIVKTYNGATVCRPDTTWERENKDIYLPEDVDGFSYSPILFARISKAGKCIGAKFASRYYDAINYGVLLYPTAIFSSEQGLAAASCLDHTSILPFPLYNICTMENGENRFELFKDGLEIYSTANGTPGMIEEAIVSASQHISLRIGDMICVELSNVTPLTIPDEKKPEIHALYCGNEIFRLNIVK
jgi:FAH family protein